MHTVKKTVDVDKFIPLQICEGFQYQIIIIPVNYRSVYCSIFISMQNILYLPVSVSSRCISYHI